MAKRSVSEPVIVLIAAPLFCLQSGAVVEGSAISTSGGEPNLVSANAPAPKRRPSKAEALMGGRNRRSIRQERGSAHPTSEATR
jgi:hypothetical protein